MPRYTRKNRRKGSKNSYRKSKRNIKNLVGGAFTNDETNILTENHFTQEQIDELNEAGVSFENFQTGNNFYVDNPRDSIVIIAKHFQNQAPLNISGISNESDDSNVSNVSDGPLNLSDEDIQQNNSNDSLHLSDLQGDDPIPQNPGDDDEPIPQNPNNQNIFDDESDEDKTDDELSEYDIHGGKRTRKTKKARKGRKGKKGRKSRKMKGGVMKGGAMFGTGVGANCSDPNYSIYNTRELELFPYTPK